jgi:uncharacterized RDD family membrane protein YckC
MTISNPQNVYASFWHRAAAFLIDSMITGPLVLVIFYLVGFDVEQFLNAKNSFSLEAGDNKISKTQDFVHWVILIFYSVYFLTAKGQATPGKKVMKIYVGNQDGAKLTPAKAVMRFVFSIFSALILGLGFLLPLFHKERAALHDVICKTRVFNGIKN